MLNMPFLACSGNCRYRCDASFVGEMYIAKDTSDLQHLGDGRAIDDGILSSCDLLLRANQV